MHTYNPLLEIYCPLQRAPGPPSPAGPWAPLGPPRVRARGSNFNPQVFLVNLYITDYQFEKMDVAIVG